MNSDRAARRSPWEPIGAAVFLLALAVGLPIALHRAIHNTGGTDFPEFYAAGRHVLEHRDRQPNSILYYYLPSVDAAWSALAWMPLPVAAAVWYLLSAGTWVGLLLAVRRYCMADSFEPYRRQAALAAGLLVMPLAVDHFCLGAFHILMLWLMALGLGRASRGRDLSGGFFLGLAVWIKLLPAVGVGYLLVKRRPLAAIMAVATAVLVDAVVSLVAFGPEEAWELHRRWWRDQGQGATGRLLSEPRHLQEDRPSNQSPAVVARRLLSTMGEPGDGQPRPALVDLPPNQLRMAYLGFLALLGLGMLWVCRRPAGGTSPAQWSVEIPLMQLATLWLSPVAWSYHFVAVAPVLAAILARKPAHPRLVWAVVAFWAFACAWFGCYWARYFGLMFWTSLALAAILVASAPRAE